MLEGVTNAALATLPSGPLARLAPAFRLACACVSWPPCDARNASVRAAAEGVEWAAFERVVRRHRIWALALAALTDAGVAAPPALAERLAQQAAGIARDNLRFAAEALRLRGLLGRFGIEALFVKGATLGELAYGGQQLKHCRDIDILVAPDRADHALAILRAEGYVNTAPAGDLGAADRAAMIRIRKDIELRHMARRINVELHWRLIDNAELLRGVGVGGPSQEIALANGALPTLGDADLFAYLCVHGATSAWFRLKWLADLNAWAASKSDAEIEDYCRRARSLGVGACAAEALILCRDLLGAEPPPALAAELERTRPQLLARGALDAMAGGGGELELSQRRFGAFRTLPAQVLRCETPRALVAQFGLLADNLDDRLALRLPQPLHFLYPVLRFPLWVARVLRRRAQAARAAGAGA